MLGTIYRTEPVDSLPAAIRTFAPIPPVQVLTFLDNEHLMLPIAEADVPKIVRGLSRYKAVGPDGLKKEFYKDTSELVVPALVAIGNQILRGGPPTPLISVGS